ncbi:SRPBCC family protein [Streptomyces sp. MST-110588]|uniref:aromatase/cyclase n=1 Tax=Streptomyces sp. MST-110588 TaxID=2833628 RepID=UPI001F5DBC24|nr:SRPBCC family protein [Streptomyces sp. MST-110588]UNO43009.1 cyclase [Streptomyces sp. MST-110588]
MAQPVTHRTEHTLTVRAPARTLYGLVADVTLWPAVFGRTVAVRHLERDRRTETFEIWTVVDGEVAHWTSRRVLDPGRLYVGFRQEHRQAPASLDGGWHLRALPGGRTEVVLRHRLRAVEEESAPLRRLRATLHRRGSEALAALARVTEQPYTVEEMVFSFTDTWEPHATAAEAYAFVRGADRWAQRLPHVRQVRVAEPAPGVQDLQARTVTEDGSPRATRSLRVCRAPGWIAEKQLSGARLALGHSATWSFTGGAGYARDRSLITVRHTVAVDPAAVAGELGGRATLADARALLRAELGAASRAVAAGVGAAATARAG